MDKRKAFIKKADSIKEISNKAKEKDKELNTFIKGESKPIKKEKSKQMKETDVESFKYQGVMITIRKNDLIKEHV